MKRKAAWAAAGMIPTLIAANYMPRFVLYLFCALVFLATIIMAFFRYRKKFIYSFFLLGAASIGLIIFLIQLESTRIPILQHDNQKISADVQFIANESGYWTVKIKEAYCNGKKINLHGTLTAPVYDATIEPYDIGTVEFMLKANKEEEYVTFLPDKFTIHAVRHPDRISVEQRLSDFRMSVIRMIQARIGGEEGNLATAFLTGEKGDLSSATQINFRRTGLSHVMAVSGLHLSVLMGMASYLLIRLPVNRKILTIASLLVVGLVMVLGDFSVSILRAGIMSAVMHIGNLCNRRSDPLNSLGLSLVTIAMISPFAVIKPSFLLSGAATAGILILSPIIDEKILKRRVLTKNQRRQLTLISVSVSSAIFTAPILLICFREISILSVPAMSIVNYPVTGVLLGTVLLCCFFWVPFLGDFLAFLVRILAELILNLVEMMAAFDQAVIPFYSLPMILFAVLCLLLIGGIYLLRSHKKIRALVAGSVILLMVSSLIWAQFYHQSFSKLIVSGSQGECTVFIDKGKSIVVNCGNSALAVDAQDALREHGFDRIDLLIVTGLQAELSEGIPWLLSYIPARQILLPGYDPYNEYYRRMLEAANHMGTTPMTITKDDRLSVGDIGVDIYDLGDHDNNFSIILDKRGKGIGIFPALDSKTIAHSVHFRNEELHVKTLITGTCAATNTINSVFLSAISPEIVIAQMTNRRSVHLTGSEVISIIAQNAQYIELTFENPEFVMEYPRES